MNVTKKCNNGIEMYEPCKTFLWSAFLPAIAVIAGYYISPAFDNSILVAGFLFIS
jgi:hypothetical protein